VARADEPRQIARYEIRRELGRGVMGVVYRAWDPVLGRTIALKTIKPVTGSPAQDEAWEKRFLIEAQAAARLSHPAIVVVYDVGRDPETGVSYMALEYLEGQTLAEKSAPGRPLPWREALRIVGQVAEGLHHAHAQGVVHRDIKPANIMIVASGDAKILDFGVARLDEGSLTNPGDLCGTPLYMSPEQASGHALDARSDIFSLGAVAWTLLTGQTPFDAPSLSAILTRVMHRSPPPPSELVSGIPKQVDEIVARALAKMPEDRYPDGRQLAEDIEDALADRVPRHRAEWNPLRIGERTRVSLGGRDKHLPALEPLKGDTAPSSGHRTRRAGVRAALLLLLVASAAAYFHVHPEDQQLWTLLAHRAAASRPGVALRSWARPPSTSTSPAAGGAAVWPDAPRSGATPARPAGLLESPSAVTADVTAHSGSEVIGASPSGATSATPHAALEATIESRPPRMAAAQDQTADTSGPRAEEPASSMPPAAPPTPQPTPTPQPPAASAAGDTVTSPSPPAPSPAQARPRPKKAPSAYLSIGFQHRLKGGTLEVWVDGVQVAKEKLDSSVTKKVLLFELRRGSIQQTLQLEPGRHEVKVRVRSNGETRSARTTAVFRAGATRRLELSLSRLSGKVALAWR
jgi:hypothetical protein